MFQSSWRNAVLARAVTLLVPTEMLAVRRKLTPPPGLFAVLVSLIAPNSWSVSVPSPFASPILKAAEVGALRSAVNALQYSVAEKMLYWPLRPDPARQPVLGVDV